MTLESSTTFREGMSDSKNLADWLMSLMAKSLKSGDSMLLHREDGDKPVDVTRVGVLEDKAELSLN